MYKFICPMWIFFGLLLSLQWMLSQALPHPQSHAGGALPQKPFAENPSTLAGSKIWKLANAHAHSSRGLGLCMRSPNDCNSLG